jgi:hypothetical protein
MSPSDGVHEIASSTDVFARVAARLDADEAARSLWLKLEQEMAAGGVSSATSYLRTRFKELSERVTAALTPGSQG